MATVYILFSEKADKYYIGSCSNFEERFEEHLTKLYSNSYTAKYDDWVLFFKVDNLNYDQARSIESHIKKMKSKRFIENLVLHPEIIQKLVKMYK